MSYLRERITRTLQAGPQSLWDVGIDNHAYPADQIQAELEAMEREGLATSSVTQAVRQYELTDADQS